jgi:hypothetical protein
MDWPNNGELNKMHPMTSSPPPYLNTPAGGGREAIHAAGEAVDGLLLDVTPEIRAAIPIARAAADAVKTQSESLRRDMGRYTGMRTAKFQNWLYEQNREWQFRDETLCVLWCVEFPDSKSDYPLHLDYVASTREDYNAGRHQNDRPAEPCVAYDRRRVRARINRG